jgi:hypothetical protein
MDLLIAREIFGIKKIHYEEWDTGHEWPNYIPSGKPWRTHRLDAEIVPQYSDDAAWLVVKRLCTLPQDRFALSGTDGQWRAEFRLADRAKPHLLAGEGVATSERVQHAICLAALQAVGVKVPA